MTTQAIRDTIKIAKLHEQEHGHLATLFNQRVLEQLPITLSSAENNNAAALVDFIIAYIDQVPKVIDAVRRITTNIKIQSHIEPILALAEGFFLKPQELSADNPGLVGLMDEAYLANRLIEEINDHFIVKVSAPLIPVDMAMSNIIVHSLIGEPFANELDEAVEYSLNKYLALASNYDTKELRGYLFKHQDEDWPHAQQWPTLTEQLFKTLPIEHS